MSKTKSFVPFVSIQPIQGEMEVTWGYKTFFKSEKDGKVTCVIPSFDIYFTAPDIDSVQKKGRALSKMFFDHYFLHNGTRGLKRFVLELHKLGFKANNDIYTISQLSRNNVIPAKFKSQQLNTPDQFSDEDSEVQESKMAFAL